MFQASKKLIFDTFYILLFVIEDALSVRTISERWFSKFRDGNFSLEDTPRSGRPTEFDEDHLEMLVKQDGKQTCRELAKTMDSNAMTISLHPKSMGFI